MSNSFLRHAAIFSKIEPVTGAQKRIRAVKDAGLLDLKNSREFGDIVDVVKTALDCPVSVISILDDDRQVFVAHVGLPGHWAEAGETPLTHSFCQHVVDDGAPFIVADATIHARVSDNLAIRDLGVVSYMGVPIVMPDGLVVGALAAIDGQPRHWTAAELGLLSKLGKVASNQIATVMSERRWSNLFQQLDEGIVIGTVIRDDMGQIVDWRYDEVNTAWGDLVGRPGPALTGRTIRNFLPDVADDWIAMVAEVIEEESPRRFTRRASATGRWFDGYIQPTGDDSFVIIFMEVTDRMSAVEALEDSAARLGLIVQGAKDYAILTIDNEHRISSWFGGAEETFGWSAGDMLGRPFAEIFSAEDRQAGVPEQEIATASGSGVALDRRWHVARDGSRVFMDGTMRPLPPDAEGRMQGFIKIARNATAEKFAEDRQLAFLNLGEKIRELDSVTDVAFAAAEIIATTLHGATRAGYGVVDPVAETVDMLPDWCGAGSFSISGLHHFRDYGSFIEDLKRGEMVIIPDVAVDPRTAPSAHLLHEIGISVLVNVPILDHGAFVGVMFVHYDKPHDFTAEEQDFVRTIADRTREAISRIRAEEEQQILNHEISHRLKNTMAMVQAIATQTLRPIADRRPVEAFTSRLHALSRAHEVLLKRNWSSAHMDAVIGAAMDQLSLPERYKLGGPDIELGPRTAMSLALLVHELGTNALKYGAWSNTTGIVSVTWETETQNGEETLVLTWLERGGPRIEKPSTRGFGSKLIRVGLLGTGGVDVLYEPEGLKVEMRGLVPQLRQS